MNSLLSGMKTATVALPQATKSTPFSPLIHLCCKGDPKATWLLNVAGCALNSIPVLFGGAGTKLGHIACDICDIWSAVGILLAFVTLWKANSHIYMNENLKIMVYFPFRHHTNSVRLQTRVFGHGWPGWKWILTSKSLANIFKFFGSGAALRAKGPARAELHTYRNGMYTKPCYSIFVMTPFMAEPARTSVTTWFM